MANYYIHDDDWDLLRTMRLPGESNAAAFHRILTAHLEPTVKNEEADRKIKQAEFEIERAKKMLAEAEVAKNRVIEMLNRESRFTTTPIPPPQPPIISQPAVQAQSFVQPKIKLNKYSKNKNSRMKLPDGRLARWDDKGVLEIWGSGRSMVGKCCRPACEEICTDKESALTFASLAKQRMRLEEIASALNIPVEAALKHGSCAMAKSLRDGTPLKEEEIFPEVEEPTMEDIRAEEAKHYE